MDTSWLTALLGQFGTILCHCRICLEITSRPLTCGVCCNSICGLHSGQLLVLLPHTLLCCYNQTTHAKQQGDQLMTNIIEAYKQQFQRFWAPLQLSCHCIQQDCRFFLDLAFLTLLSHELSSTYNCCSPALKFICEWMLVCKVAYKSFRAT